MKWKLGNEEGGPRSSSQQIDREKGTWGEEAPRDPRESGVQKANLFFFSLWCISPCGVWGLQNFKENIGKVMFSFSKVQVKTPPREL